VDAAFLIVVGAALGLLSVLIGVRLAAGGASARQIAALVIELWVVFALWMTVLAATRSAVGAPAGASVWAEVRDVSNRLASLWAGVRYGLGMGLAVGLGACVHLVVTLGRAMGVHPLRVTGGEE